MLVAQQPPVLHQAKDIQQWAGGQKFEVQELDCMVAVMLKILDKKCQMRPETQQLFIDIYLAIEKKESEIFDPSIHDFVEKVFDQPDALSLRKIHELRMFAEATIDKPVMKRFKQSFSFLMG